MIERLSEASREYELEPQPNNKYRSVFRGVTKKPLSK